VFASPRLALSLGGGASLDLRAAASHLYYEVADSAGPTLVRSPGAGLSLGLRWSAPGVSAAAGAGYEQRWTRRRSPAGAEQRVAERGPVVHAELFIGPAHRTTAFAFGTYGHANRYIWARAGAVHRAPWRGSPRPGAGVELTAQGNDDVRAWQLGGMASLEFPPVRLSLQARAGGAWLRHAGGRRESRPYLGVGAWRGF
jgi:hypothetical protein